MTQSTYNTPDVALVTSMLTIFCLADRNQYLFVHHTSMHVVTTHIHGQYKPTLSHTCTQFCLVQETNLNAPAIKKWLAVGALPSSTVENLLMKAFVIEPKPRVWTVTKPPKEAGAEKKE